MDISAITSFLKLPRKVIFLLSVISAALLFPGQEFLEKLALYDFKEEFKLWIGICFLFSTGLSIFNCGEYVFKIVREHNRAKKEELERSKLAAREKAEQEAKRNEYIKTLERLDKYELSNIREFFLQQQNTIKMSIEDPVVIGLVKKGVIKQVGDKGYHNNLTGLVTFFSIDSRAIDYLESYDYTTMNHIERPMWVNGILSERALNEKIAELKDQMLRF
ncbi:super-infection exclusion protein B [Vibrio navarrensis]|uniref:super-infection exclusion protein B n=1 Tax=Vibrio navarrensis TaxID=29495 RepID=UPI0018DBC80B|nr:hypothetical protein [Vibrio navarrensis]